MSIYCHYIRCTNLSKSHCSEVSWTWENRWCRLIIVNAIGFLIQIFWTLCQIYLLVLPVASKQACSCINQNAWILLFSAMPFMSWPSTGFPSCFSLLFAIFFCRMLLKKDLRRNSFALWANAGFKLIKLSVYTSVFSSPANPWTVTCIVKLHIKVGWKTWSPMLENV